MLSYTGLRNKFGVLVNNTNSTVLTNADGWINDAIRIFMAETNGDYTEATSTSTTTASTQNYALPYDYEKMNSVTITQGNFKYPIKEVKSRMDWDRLQLTTGITATPSRYYFIDAGQIYFWPTPATSALTITFNYKKIVRDLSIADITTSTITTLANGSTALTLNAGLTNQMVGFWIKPTYSTTASTGDGMWYQFSSITSTTVAVLARAYGGVSIATGTVASIISQMPIIPEAYHHNLVDYAVSEYWEMLGEQNRAAFYRSKWNEALKAEALDVATKSNSMVLDAGVREDIINPNLTIWM